MKTLALILFTFVGLTLVSYAQVVYSAPATSQQKVLYYTCSMHPEVRMSQPGDCPKCGMTLQPFYEGQNSNTQTSDGAEDHSMNHGMSGNHSM